MARLQCTKASAEADGAREAFEIETEFLVGADGARSTIPTAMEGVPGSRFRCAQLTPRGFLEICFPRKPGTRSGLLLGAETQDQSGGWSYFVRASAVLDCRRTVHDDTNPRVYKTVMLKHAEEWRKDMNFSSGAADKKGRGGPPRARGGSTAGTASHTFAREGTRTQKLAAGASWCQLAPA